jgi:hypothetical protein
LATGKTVKAINYEAGPVELKILHMITGDPRRTPTVTLFGNTDFWYSSAAQYDSNVPASCDSSLFCEPSGQGAARRRQRDPQQREPAGGPQLAGHSGKPRQGSQVASRRARSDYS